MGLQRFPFNDYSGGVNLQDGPSALKPNEAQMAVNVLVSVRNVLSQRPGTTKLNGTGFPEGKRVENARPWYTSAARRLMLSIDGDIYSMVTGGTLTERFNGTAGTIWAFEDMEKTPGLAQIWMMNGTDNPKKWNGTTFTDWEGEPPNGTMCKVWKNRMCVAGDPDKPQRLYYSEPGDPEKPANETANGGYGDNFIDIRTSEDDVQPITGMEVIGESLLIFKKGGVFAIFDSETFSFRRIAEVGAESRFQTCVVLDRCYFFNRSGIYSVTQSGALRYESRKLEPIFKATHDDFPINLNLLEQVRVAATPDRKVMVSIPSGGSETNNLIIEGIVDLKSEDTDNAVPWLLHTLNASSLCIYRQGNSDELVGGDSENAQLLRFFVGTNDDGEAIESDYFPSWRKFLAEEPLERLRRFNLQLEGAVTVEIYNDLDGGTLQFSERLETEADQPLEWNDEEEWNDGLPWNATSGTQFQRVRPETRAQYHAPRFRNAELDKTWKISMGEFAFRGGKEHTK